MSISSGARVSGLRRTTNPGFSLGELQGLMQIECISHGLGLTDSGLGCKIRVQGLGCRVSQN